MNRIIWIVFALLPSVCLSQDRSLDDFKGVIVLDTKGKQNDFDLLSGKERSDFFRAAKAIRDMNTSVQEVDIDGKTERFGLETEIRSAALNSHLLDKAKRVKWLSELGRKLGAEDLISGIKAAKEKHDDIAIQFAIASRNDRRRAIAIGKTIGESGLSGLNTRDKMFVADNKRLFALD